MHAESIGLPAADVGSSAPDARWTTAAVEALFELPFADLLYRAQQVHRWHFDPSTIQFSTLLSVKTGGCSEDCGYCSQSAHHPTEIERETQAS